MTVFPPRSVHFSGKSIYGIWRSFGDAKMKWISHATVPGMDHELRMPPEWEKNWQFTFLQCVALLTRYTPWPCVRLSVCVWYNVWVGVLSKQLNNLLELVFGMETAPSTYPALCCTPKQGYFRLDLCPKLWTYTYKISPQQKDRLIKKNLSTVELVDHTYDGQHICVAGCT